MSGTDRRVEVFFGKLKTWREELPALRTILLGSGLREDFKWRSPVYTFGGASVAILWGFKDYAGLGFFKGVLLRDPAGILIAQGENSRSARIVKFTSVSAVGALDQTLRAYIREAITIEQSGVTVALPKNDLDYPPELVDRLDGDPDVRAAFEALTPGRRRGYALHIAQAKKSETRVARIEKCLPNIFAGKGFDGR